MLLRRVTSSETRQSVDLVLAPRPSFGTGSPPRRTPPRPDVDSHNRKHVDAVAGARRCPPSALTVIAVSGGRTCRWCPVSRSTWFSSWQPDPSTTSRLSRIPPGMPPQRLGLGTRSSQPGWHSGPQGRFAGPRSYPRANQCRGRNGGGSYHIVARTGRARTELRLPLCVDPRRVLRRTGRSGCGSLPLLDGAVRFITALLLEHGPHLAPAYRIDGTTIRISEASTCPATRVDTTW